MSLQVRMIIENEIMRYKNKTGLPLDFILSHAGISRRTWYEWLDRRGVETKHNNNIPKNYYLTPEEERAIIAYIIDNPLKGYRILCYEMIDKNIAFVSCSSVYNVIKRHNLGKKWVEAQEMKKRGCEPWFETSLERFTSNGTLIFRTSG